MTDILWNFTYHTLLTVGIMELTSDFWIQYHSHDDIVGPTSTANTHLLCPSESLETFANHHKLLPYCKYINLNHSDTFIHGPFNFVIINQRKSRDRITQTEWDILRSHSDMFHSPIPRFDVPTYSVHVNRSAHTTFHCSAIVNSLISSAKHNLHTPGIFLYP